jgi:hypothetical protein
VVSGRRIEYAALPREDVKLFIDASVALAAAGQKTGASRAIFGAASSMHWELQVVWKFEFWPHL